MMKKKKQKWWKTCGWDADVTENNTEEAIAETWLNNGGLWSNGPKEGEEAKILMDRFREERKRGHPTMGSSSSG